MFDAPSKLARFLRKGWLLRFANMPEKRGVRLAKPGRKAGTDRSSRLVTTVPERIPEGFHSAKRSRTASGG
jgi:hypothetical protein